jgi:hypothetical protein
VEIGPLNKDSSLPRKKPESHETAPGQVTDNSEERDKLAISEEARRLGGGKVEDKGISEAESARLEKLRAVRRRVENGFYNRPDIIEKMAEMMSESKEFTETIPEANMEPNPDDTGNIEEDGLSGDEKTGDHDRPAQDRATQ